MAAPTVTNTFSNTTTADATEVNQNFDDIINALTDGNSDLTISALTVGGAADFNSTVALGSAVTYEMPPISMYSAPKFALEWKTVATIDLQAGRYFIGGLVRTLAAAYTWNWLLDTGAEATSTWYYLYAYWTGSAVQMVASTTAPTATFDTDLAGGTTYDTNTYLGAFYNDSGDDIIPFTQVGNRFYYNNLDSTQVSTTSNSYQERTLEVPETAIAGFGKLNIVIYSVAGSNFAIISLDGTNEYISVNLDNDGGGDYSNTIVVEFPFLTAQKIWLKTTTGGADTNAQFRPYGWVDKWVQ